MVLFYPMLPDIPKSTPGFAVCPSDDSNFKIKMNTKRYWNVTARIKP
jgi:hypothetical protein